MSVRAIMRGENQQKWVVVGGLGTLEIALLRHICTLREPPLSGRLNNCVNFNVLFQIYF